MLKTFAFYTVIVAVLVIATIASRRNGTKPARPQTRLEQPLTQDDIR